MIEYVIGGALLLAYVAYRRSTPEQRRRWLTRVNAPSRAALDDGDPTASSLLDEDTGGHRGHHRHHGHHGRESDHSHHGDHGDHGDQDDHGGDFDTGGADHH